MLDCWKCGSEVVAGAPQATALKCCVATLLAYLHFLTSKIGIIFILTWLGIAKLNSVDFTSVGFLVLKIRHALIYLP